MDPGIFCLVYTCWIFQKYVPDYPAAAPAPAVPRSLGYSRLAAPEKKMVKLAPLRMAASHTFDRSVLPCDWLIEVT